MRAKLWRVNTTPATTPRNTNKHAQSNTNATQPPDHSAILHSCDASLGFPPGCSCVRRVWSAIRACSQALAVHLGRLPHSPTMRALGTRARSCGRAPPRIRCEPGPIPSLPRFCRYVVFGLCQGSSFLESWNRWASTLRGADWAAPYQAVGNPPVPKTKSYIWTLPVALALEGPPDAHRMATPRSTTNGYCVPWGRFTTDAKTNGLSYHGANSLAPPPNSAVGRNEILDLLALSVASPGWSKWTTPAQTSDTETS